MDIITVAFHNDVPKIAFWQPDAAANYAIRQHRTDYRLQLHFVILDIVPWEDTLVAECVDRLWIFEGLASTHGVEYARLIIPLV